MLSHECKSSESKINGKVFWVFFFDKWMMFFLISIKSQKAEDLC